jgi:predicted transcriptional regulator
MKHFKVEIRKNCKICGKSLPKRYRTFCSKKCRNKSQYLKHKEYRAKKQKEYNDKKHMQYQPGTLQCKICGKWYIQVGTHIVQKHGMTAREYREEYNLPVRRGITPKWYRKKKGKIALKNKTFENLKNGKKYRFKKGDKRAKQTIFWKSRRYKSDNFYE